MSVEDLKYHHISGPAIKCGLQVYSFFGAGYPEIVYKKALRIDFSEISLDFKYEQEQDIYYKDNHIYSRRFDFIIEQKVLLEVKALKEITNSEVNQILNYLKVFNLEVGLLFNFGQDKFFVKRFIKKDM